MDIETEYRLAEFVRSDEWKHIRAILLDKMEIMGRLESIKALLPQGSNEQWGEEAKARYQAIDIVADWIGEVEGIEEQQREKTDKFVEEPIIIHH